MRMRDENENDGTDALRGGERSRGGDTAQQWTTRALITQAVFGDPGRDPESLRNALEQTTPSGSVGCGG